jgi:dihydrofolate reductase
VHVLADPSSPRIVFVVAVARNGIIGQAGALPWHLPGDLRRFRERTMGRPLIMGRRTYQSIGRPLPGRETIVLTRDDRFMPEGVFIARSLAQAMRLAAERAQAMGVNEVMVVGGADVYEALLPFATDMHLTEVDLEPDGDAVFPALDPAAWSEVSRETFAADAANGAACTVRVLRRRD